MSLFVFLFFSLKLHTWILLILFSCIFNFVGSFLYIIIFKHISLFFLLDNFFITFLLYFLSMKLDISILVACLSSLVFFSYSSIYSSFIIFCFYSGSFMFIISPISFVKLIFSFNWDFPSSFFPLLSFLLGTYLFSCCLFWCIFNFLGSFFVYNYL